MNKKTLMTASLVVAVTGVISASTACSSDDSTGSGSSGFSCPAVGSKPCPNDPATTQAVYDLCKKCETELKAVATCQGTTTAKCAADGTSESGDATKCKAENDAVGKCVLGGAGGTDGGG